MNKQNASRCLSFLLRHCKDPLYIDLNGGWAEVSVIVSVIAQRFSGFDEAILSEIVAEDKKTRYSYDLTRTRIRANQGHSIPGVVIEMERPEPPAHLYHGTAVHKLDSIMTQGLLPMSRQYVHLSADRSTAQSVGGRHGKPVVLLVDAKRFAEDGHLLMRSDNGVWQAEQVSPAYLTILKD